MFAKKKFLKRKKCNTLTPLYYLCFYGVKSVYNKKIRRFLRNQYKSILTYYKPFFSSIRGLKVRFFRKEIKKFSREHEYD